MSERVKVTDLDSTLCSLTLSGLSEGGGVVTIVIVVVVFVIVVVIVEEVVVLVVVVVLVSVVVVLYETKVVSPTFTFHLLFIPETKDSIFI